MTRKWFWRDRGINRQIKYTAYYLIILIILLCSIVDIAVSETSSLYLFPHMEEFKYVTKRKLAENSHIILVCPELEKESNIEWFKDDNFLNSSFRNNMGYGKEPHLTIDAYNSLYILHATKHEKGTYTCIIDGHNVQKFIVEIVSKSRLLSEDFIRFSIYLGFVLFLTLLCYCAGICLACHKRPSFADPLNLYNHNPRRGQHLL